jgi:hypothetical protein
MSKVLVVRYDAQELFHVPDWLDLEDTTQVRSYHVKWSILHVFLTDDRHITIKPVYDNLDFDTKHGDCCEIDDADEYDLEDEEPVWEEAPVIDYKKQGLNADADATFIKYMAEKVVCDIFDKIKAEAEAKAEAANLTRTSVINPNHICGLTGGECNGFRGCRKEVDMDETNMIGNTSFCIPCYEKLEEIITDENSEDENSEDEDEDE